MERAKKKKTAKKKKEEEKKKKKLAEERQDQYSGRKEREKERNWRTDGMKRRGPGARANLCMYAHGPKRNGPFSPATTIFLSPNFHLFAQIQPRGCFSLFLEGCHIVGRINEVPETGWHWEKDVGMKINDSKVYSPQMSFGLRFMLYTNKKAQKKKQKQLGRKRGDERINNRTGRDYNSQIHSLERAAVSSSIVWTLGEGLAIQVPPNLSLFVKFCRSRCWPYVPTSWISSTGVTQQSFPGIRDENRK